MMLNIMPASAMPPTDNCRVLMPQMKAIFYACTDKFRSVGSPLLFKSDNDILMNFKTLHVKKVEGWPTVFLHIYSRDESSNDLLNCAINGRDIVFVQSQINGDESVTWKKRVHDLLPRKKWFDEVEAGERDSYRCIYDITSDGFIEKDLPPLSGDKPLPIEEHF